MKKVRMRPAKLLLLAGSLVVVAALFAYVGLAAASAGSIQPHFGPRAAQPSANVSGNWAGYAIATNLANLQNNSVTDVRGQWTVPAVTETTMGYSAAWLGIDGYSDNTVEQIGTEQDWVGGAPVYFAWYELAPRPPRTIARVYPGDRIAASVSYLGQNRFKLTLQDQTAGHAFTFSTIQVTSASRSSAEWIVEAPSSSRFMLPLADFGTVSFTGATATVNSHTGAISDPAWQADTITMVSRGGGTVAQPSSLSAAGHSFSVSWVSSGLVRRAFRY